MARGVVVAIRLPKTEAEQLRRIAVQWHWLVGKVLRYYLDLGMKADQPRVDAARAKVVAAHAAAVAAATP
jgi:hypothetical protein